MSRGATVNRRALRKRYGGAYKSLNNKRGYTCVYCGDSANHLDHIPSLASLDALGVHYFREIGVSLITVESCAECNSLLGSRDFYSVKERKRYLKLRYLERYEKILHSPDFSNQELKEFGDNLKQLISSAQSTKGRLIEKLRVLTDPSKATQ